MSEQEIRLKINQCENDLRNTNSPLRKRDLHKYRKRLMRELKKARAKGYETNV